MKSVFNTFTGVVAVLALAVATPALSQQGGAGGGVALRRRRRGWRRWRWQQRACRLERHERGKRRQQRRWRQQRWWLQRRWRRQQRRRLQRWRRGHERRLSGGGGSAAAAPRRWAAHGRWAASVSAGPKPAARRCVPARPATSWPRTPANRRCPVEADRTTATPERRQSPSRAAPTFPRGNGRGREQLDAVRRLLVEHRRLLRRLLRQLLLVESTLLDVRVCLLPVRPVLPLRLRRLRLGIPLLRSVLVQFRRWVRRFPDVRRQLAVGGWGRRVHPVVGRRRVPATRADGPPARTS